MALCTCRDVAGSRNKGHPSTKLLSPHVDASLILYSLCIPSQVMFLSFTFHSGMRLSWFCLKQTKASPEKDIMELCLQTDRCKAIYKSITVEWVLPPTIPSCKSIYRNVTRQMALSSHIRFSIVTIRHPPRTTVLKSSEHMPCQRCKGRAEKCLVCSTWPQRIPSYRDKLLSTTENMYPLDCHQSWES